MHGMGAAGNPSQFSGNMNGPMKSSRQYSALYHRTRTKQWLRSKRTEEIHLFMSSLHSTATQQNDTCE
ncbi:unnamed protein product [Caretta caretta]